MRADDVPVGGDEPRDWYEAFRSQSVVPQMLGEFTWDTELSGGLSGARVALILCNAERGGQEALVLKWGPLDEIVREANARREVTGRRSDLRADLERLRRRGGSHVAIRRSPASPDVLFGIIGSPYAGSLDDATQDRISDVQELVQVTYVERDDIAAKDLRFIFKVIARELAPVPESPTPPQHAIDLPDLKDIGERVAGARDGLAGRGADVRVLDGLAGWLHRRLGRQVAYPDSRVVHGDPRFANIVVDRNDNSVTLIDFGEGGAGRHVFHDLARFEVDVLFRSTPPHERAVRTAEIVARSRLLQTEEETRPSTPRAHRVAELWREERIEREPRLAPRRGAFELFSMFVLNELLRRGSWYRKEGRTAQDVGATPDEIVLAIESWVALLKESEKKRAERVPQGVEQVTENSVRGLLDAWGVDWSTWGTGDSKTLAHLVGEVRDGDCELVIHDGGLVRRVRNVWVDVFGAVGGERMHLVEARQEFTDGRVRARRLPASLGEKSKIGEDPAAAARRALTEELGIDTPVEVLPAASRHNPEGRSSFPGLRTIYDTRWFTADLPDALVRVQGYVEVQPDKRTIFVWES